MRGLLIVTFFSYAISADALNITNEISGSWYNPQQDGHGFILEVIEGDRLVVYWFTYDPQGKQAWVVGVGDIEGNSATVPVIITEGGVFGKNFDPQAVTKKDWGQLFFTFDACDSGTVDYNLEFGAGSLSIKRLTSIQGLECQSDDFESDEVLAEQMTSLINQARSESRLCGDELFAPAPAVAWNEKLEAAALVHSRDMAEHNFFSHTGSDGGNVATRVSAQDYPWMRVGENIAAGSHTPEQTMELWLDSPGHCANIMDPAFTEVGAARVETTEADFPVYWTLVLADR